MGNKAGRLAEDSSARSRVQLSMIGYSQYFLAAIWSYLAKFYVASAL